MATPRSGGGPPPEAVRAIWSIAVASGLVAGLLLWQLPAPQDALLPGSQTVVLALLVASFAAVERLVFHVEFRREAISFAPSEIPLAFGLVFLSPWMLVVARIVGSTAIGLFSGAQPPAFKRALNLAVFSLEVAVASSILRWSVAPDGAEAGLGLWLGLFFGIAVASGLGGLVVSLAVSVFDGNLRGMLSGQARFGHLLYLIGAGAGVLSVIPVVVHPYLLFVPALAIAAVWAVFRAHGELGQRYSDLQDVHGFTRKLASAIDVGGIARVGVHEARALLRAEQAVLVIFATEDTALRVASGEEATPEALSTSAADAASLAELCAEPTIVTPATSTHARVRALAAAGIDEAILAPLADEVGNLGWLMVADRAGAVDHFAEDDIARAAAIADQLTISLRKALYQERIEHESTHDSLTGVPNRTLFEMRVDRALRDDEQAGMVLVDLNHFTQVNEALGHEVGDDVLRESCRRIAAVLRPHDLLARVAGDEFAAYLPGADDGATLRVANRISAALGRPLQLDGLDVVVAGTVGTAVRSAPEDTAVSMLRRADVALAWAKKHHAAVARFSPELDAQSEARLIMYGELRTAIQAKTLGVHFQPKVDLRSGEIIGAEALARWVNPRLGRVPPDTFVPLAEQTGLVRPLTMLILERTAETMRRWRDIGIELRVSINLSAYDLADAELPEAIASTLASHEIAPESIAFEITEGALVGDVERTLPILDRLHDMGCHLAVDDFGRGYSSLTYLRRLPVDELKIDKSFVLSLLSEPLDEVIVRSTIDLGHDLGLTVVAEGVEQRAIAERLRALGCDTAQGYAIMRPLSADRFQQWYFQARTRRLLVDAPPRLQAVK